MISRMRKAEPKATVERLCGLLELPVSTYYYRPVIDIEMLNLELKAKEIFEASFGTYGKRRMSKALKKQGFEVGIFQASTLMKQLLLVAKRPRKPHYYPIGQEKPTIPNRLDRQFNPNTLHTHWVGDITYLRSHQGWSYLATVMDLGSKEIVGYALSQTPDAELAKKALTNAVAKHQPKTQGLMFHSDQGVQYCAKSFQQSLSDHGMIQSMSRRGCCWDNAVQERFFRNLKTEYLNDLTFINHQSVGSAVEQYIHFYNNKRLNSAVDYLTPAEKRQKLLNAA